MTAQQMIHWTRDGEGTAEKPADPAIRVDVHDIDGQIATATVHNAVYVEHVHLVRTPDGWRILNTVYIRLAPG